MRAGPAGLLLLRLRGRRRRQRREIDSTHGASSNFWRSHAHRLRISSAARLSSQAFAVPCGSASKIRVRTPSPDAATASEQAKVVAP